MCISHLPRHYQAANECLPGDSGTVTRQHTYRYQTKQRTTQEMNCRQSDTNNEGHVAPNAPNAPIAPIAPNVY
jgi:hypothetical protein